MLHYEAWDDRPLAGLIVGSGSPAVLETVTAGDADARQRPNTVTCAATPFRCDALMGLALGFQTAGAIGLGFHTLVEFRFLFRAIGVAEDAAAFAR